MHTAHTDLPGVPPFLRRTALLLLFVTAALAGTLFSTQTRAHAFAGAPVPVTLPLSLVGGGGIGAGTGAIATFGGGGGAAAAAVAVAPVALAAAAAVATGAALYVGWKWAGNASSAGTSYDPPVAATAPIGGDWTSAVCTGVSDACAWTSGSPAGAGFNLLIEGYGVQADRAPTGSEVMTFSWSRYGTSSLTLNTYKLRCRTTVGGSIFDGPNVSLGSMAAGSVTVDLNACPTGFPYNLSAAHSGGTAATYAFPTAAAPAPVSSNPGTTQVTTRPTSQCSNGSSVVGQAIVFTGNTSPDLLPDIVAPACPAGTTRTGFTTPSTFPDGSAAPAPMAPWTAPTIPTGYPECSPAGTCVLTLTQTAADARSTVCNGNTACLGWASDSTPERVTTRTDTGTQLQNLPDGTTRRVVPMTRPNGDVMRCVWGPYTLPGLECSTIATEAPPVTETQGSNCDASGFSFNPVSWVVVPLKCLFIPSPGSLDATGTDLTTAWGGSPPGVVSGALTDIFGPLTNLTPDTDCMGPLIEFQVPTGQTVSYHPLNACSSLAQFVLGIVMPMLSAFTYVTAFTIGSRSLLKTIGADTEVRT